MLRTDLKPTAAIQLLRKACKTVSAVMSAIGTASGHLVVRSIIVKIYLFPCSGGKGPTISTWTWAKCSTGTGIGLTGGAVCLAILLVAQALHWPAQRRISRRMPRHTYDRAIMAKVALPEGWAKLWRVLKIWRRRDLGVGARATCRTPCSCLFLGNKLVWDAANFLALRRSVAVPRRGRWDQRPRVCGRPN